MNPSTSAEWWRPVAAPSVDSATTRPSGRSLPFWALMGFTAVMLLAPQNFFPILEPLRLALVAAVVATAAYAWDRLTHRRAAGAVAREVWLSVLLAGWSVLTIPFSYAPGDSAAFFLNYYSKALVIFWLVGSVVDSSRRLGQTFWLLSLIAVPLAITGIANFFSGVYLSTTGMQRIQGYDAPLTANPNDLALMLNIILPLTVALLLAQRKPARRLLLLGAIGLSAAAIVVTFSRGGFLTLASLFALYVWRLRRRPQRRWIWALIPLALVCIPLIGPAYLDRLSTITNMDADKTFSAQERWSDMKAAARFALAHPLLGAGIGQNMLATREERGPDGGLVHNVYLQYAVELGLPGALLFVLLLAAAIKSAALVQRRAREAGNGELFYYGEAIQLSLIGFALSAMFYPVGYHIHSYYLAGLAVAARGVPQTDRAHGSK